MEERGVGVLPEEGIILVEDLAGWMGITSYTLKEYLKRKHVPVIKPARKWLVRLSDISKLFDVYVSDETKEEIP